MIRTIEISPGGPLVQGEVVETLLRCMGRYHRHTYRCCVCDRATFATVRTGPTTTATGRLIPSEGMQR